jgi:Fe-S-cluster containining protein
MTNTPQPGEAGLNRIFCNYCPAFCCYRLEGSVLLITAIDINRLARHLGLSDGEVRRRYIENRNTFKVREDGSCVFLHNGRLSKRCSVHEARPLQCRDFPYDDPCPYLRREDLLAKIYPRMEKSLGLPSE